MKLSLLAAATLAFALAACAGNTSGDATSEVGELNADAPITLANWISHPKIVEVRREVDEIDTASFVPETKKGLCENSGHGESERSMSTDAHLTVRELDLSFGSEDSATTDHYYYDAAGTLRFLFRTRGDVHGNVEETRVYFDGTGKRIWEIYRHAFSETFQADITKAAYVLASGDVEIEADAKNPKKIFASPARCD